MFQRKFDRLCENISVRKSSVAGSNDKGFFSFMKARSLMSEIQFSDYIKHCLCVNM